jgi:hypothetical protein
MYGNRIGYVDGRNNGIGRGRMVCLLADKIWFYPYKTVCSKRLQA